MRHLLILNIGPVQDFIARARRTRDLWFGSHLLSELSRAAAMSVADSGGTLVFPALETGDAEFVPCNGRWRPGRVPPLAIVNKVSAIVDDDPEGVAARARAAMTARWKELWNQAHKRAGALVRRDLGKEELEDAIEDVLELYAGWTDLANDADYGDARRKIDRAVAARKNLRDFRQWKGSTRPKSSLDGLRETILVEPKYRDDSMNKAARLGRLGSTEQLDAIGFVKRFGGDPTQFTSIAEVAVRDWLDEAGGLANAGLGHVDAQAFFPDRWPELRAEGENLPEDDLKAFLKKYGNPSPYVACLVADGDHMGEALGRDDRIDAHQKLSRRLCEFARFAHAEIESRFKGVAVFTGGDDILAFLPVSQAVAAADCLRREFSKVADGVTLSVGLGIGHFLVPMSELLALGRRAERLAKGDGLKDERNALAILLSKRSGGESAFRARWNVAPCLIDTVKDALVAKKIPRGFHYELHQLVLARIPTEDDAAGTYAKILRDEIRHTWNRKRPASVKDDAPPGLDPGTASRADVVEWFALVNVATHLAESERIVRCAREAK